MSKTSQNQPFWPVGETIYTPQLAVEIGLQNRQRVARKNFTFVFKALMKMPEMSCDPQPAVGIFLQNQ